MKKFKTHYFYSNGQKQFSYKINFPAENGPHFSLPLIVFNYGLVCNFEHWSKQLPYFNERGYPILIHNYRGHFSSTPIDSVSELDFSVMADDLSQIIAPFKFKKICMVGHSMGVNVTLEYTKLNVDSLKGIVLISGTVFPPHGTMFDSHVMDLLMPWIDEFSRTFPKPFQMIWEKSGHLQLVQRMVRRGGFNVNKVGLDFVKHYLLKTGELDPRLFFHLFELMKHHQIISYLKNIHLPCLIMSGEKDKIVPNHFQDYLWEKIPNADYYLIKEAGHVPQVEFPQLVNDRLLKFIQKL